MEFYVKPMTLDSAIMISKWVYEEPYTLYSMDGSEACVHELVSGSYFSVTNDKGEIIGFYCFGRAAQVPAGDEFGVYEESGVIDIGLGVNPILCGRGLGYSFLKSELEFAKKEFTAVKYRLTVASFNKRAVKVYERLGFKKITSFERVSENKKTEFLVMVR